MAKQRALARVEEAWLQTIAQQGDAVVVGVFVEVTVG